MSLHMSNRHLVVSLRRVKDTKLYAFSLEIKYTTDTQKSPSYLDLHLEFDNGEIKHTNSMTKRDDCIFNSQLLVHYQ